MNLNEGLGEASIQNITRTSRAPALTFVNDQGFVIYQDAAAQRTAGKGIGNRCCEVMGTIPGSEDFPCHPGCATQLLDHGVGHTVTHLVRLSSRVHKLTCISLGKRALCVLDDCARAQCQPWQRLTPREREVLALMSEGSTTAQIASELGLSPATVRTHVEHMRDRFGVTTRAALISRCFRTGLID